MSLWRKCAVALLFVCWFLHALSVILVFGHGQGNAALHCTCSGLIRHFALSLLGSDTALCTTLCSGYVTALYSTLFATFASALLAVMRHILHRVVCLALLSVCVFPACEGAMQYGLSAFLVLFTPSCKKSLYFRRFPSIYLIKRNGILKCKFTFFKFHFSVREIL